MAKPTSIISLKGTIDGLTFVKSSAYGDHVRAARGTYKNAKLNEEFAKNTRIISGANPPAQVIRNAIKLHAKNLNIGSLWGKLVSFCFRELKTYGAVDLGKLDSMEMDKKHQLGKLIGIQAHVSVDAKAGHLDVKVTCFGAPDFHNVPFIDGYRISVVPIFPNLTRMEAMSAELSTDILPLTEVVSPLTFRVPIPPDSEAYLICLRIEGCMKGVINNTPTTQGMSIVASGRLDDARSPSTSSKPG